MDNDQLIRYFELAVLYTTGYLMLTVSTNNGRMEFQSSDIMTLAMLIVTFLILFVEFCHARSLSGKHQRHTDISASIGDNFVSHNCFCYFFSPPGMTFLEPVRAHELVVISGLLVY
jgi:hypothetical protein